MVEHTLNFNDVFASLADETRRDILGLVSTRALTIKQIAANYELTYGAISKHVLVLERARLVTKRRRGKEQVVQVAPDAISEAESYLKNYLSEWESRLSSFERYMAKHTSK